MRLIALLVSGILTPFAPPLPYQAGHRGVDFQAQAGASVTAPTTGVVTYVGSIAGVGTITISTGVRKVTLQPVQASVKVHQLVRWGERIGTVQAVTYHCSTCLHLGVRENGKYINPLGYSRQQLIPTGRSSWIDDQ